MKIIVLSILIIPLLILSGCSIAPNYTTNTDQKINKTVETEVKIPTDDTPIKTTNNEEINLSNQGLTKVPSSIFEKTNTQTLDVSNNKLTGALPGEIRFLKNLKVLKASNNMMTGVPAEVGQLSNLEILDLSNNQLTGLPNELGNLKNLKTMNLSGNDYSEQDLNYIKERLPNTNFIL